MFATCLWQVKLATSGVPVNYIQSCRLFGVHMAKAKATDPPDKTNRDHEKLIKIAIVGVPNAGKSTFINNLINHRICPTSSKVHTTRTFSKAITVKNNSQIILFDTPGLVTDSEARKHHLDSGYTSASRHSIQHADLMGVVHDVSNTWARNELHSTVLETLRAYPKIPSFLILNKIDALKSKRILLDLTRTLTDNTLLPKGTAKKHILEIAKNPTNIKTKPERAVGWPHFSEVFMISSITGDGMGGVMKFLLARANKRHWEYRADEYTDQPPEELVVQSVRAQLLNFLPQEIPYLLKSEIEYYTEENGQIFASVQVTCPSERIERLVCGEKDGKLRQITERVTSDLIETFGQPISLTLATRTVKGPI